MVFGLYAHVSNYGGSNAGPFDFDVEGVRRRVESVAAGGSESVFFARLPGGSSLWAIADVNDEVAEQYEDNNEVRGWAPVPTLPLRCTATPGPTPTTTPTPVVVGELSIELAGTPVSCQDVDFSGVFSATSGAAAVTQMRARLDPYETCHGADDRIVLEDWQSFATRLQYTVPGGPRVFQAALGVQYRDAVGNVSPVYCRDAHGSCPATPTASPSVSPTTPTASATPGTLAPTRTPTPTPTPTRTPTRPAYASTLYLPRVLAQ
jgi:hypothetical protein